MQRQFWIYFWVLVGMHSRSSRSFCNSRCRLLHVRIWWCFGGVVLVRGLRASSRCPASLFSSVYVLQTFLETQLRLCCARIAFVENKCWSCCRIFSWFPRSGGILVPTCCLESVRNVRARAALAIAHCLMGIICSRYQVVDFWLFA